MKKESFLPGTSFVRSGKLSSFKEEVDSSLIEYFENRSERMLTKYYQKYEE
jgi:hypothetical protein